MKKQPDEKDFEIKGFTDGEPVYYFKNGVSIGSIQNAQSLEITYIIRKDELNDFFHEPPATSN